MGGINDLLCQIGECIKYSKMYNRKLIIDTRTISDLNEDFCNYFSTNDSSIQLSLTDEQIKEFHMDPSFPKDTILTCDRLNPLARCIINSVDWPDKFLIHRAFGGGLESAYALTYFTLVDYLSDSIKKRKKELGAYHSILIRNTDYKTDYMGILCEIKQMNLDVPLFLFTDDYHVQDYAKTLMFNKLIINENLYRSNAINTPIMHTSHFMTNISPKTINDEVLTDLFLAAMSDHIYPTYISGFKDGKEFENMQIKSGFVNLAMHLNTNQELLNNILVN